MHKHRKSNRWVVYDYSHSGLYFLTICTKDRVPFFGKIENQKMIFNQNGLIVQKHLLKLKTLFENETIEIFQIMPNHIHLIYKILVSKDGLYQLNSNGLINENRSKMTLSKRIQSFKRSVSIEINRHMLGEFQWQRSFYDHVIRNEKSHKKIHKYILDNPTNWKDDKDNPTNFVK